LQAGGWVVAAAGWTMAAAAGSSQSQGSARPVVSHDGKEKKPQHNSWAPNLIFRCHLLETLGDDLLFSSPNLFRSCQTTSF